jgi:DNA-binding Lrp family transcriptional regulator
MRTVSQVASSFGISRDELHYLIKVAVKKGELKPQKLGNRFILTDEDVKKLRQVLNQRLKPWAAIMTLKVTGLKTKDAVDKLKDEFPEVVWAAGAWGDMSVIALLEAGKFENIASVPIKLRDHLDYVNDSRTYIIPSQHYHVKKPPLVEEARLAVVLINLAKPSDKEKPSDRSAVRVAEDLGDIISVRRYGIIFGPWDCFAEIRHRDSDELYEIVTQQIYGITGVLDTTTILTMSKIRREEETSPFLWTGA